MESFLRDTKNTQTFCEVSTDGSPITKTSSGQALDGFYLAVFDEGCFF